MISKFWQWLINCWYKVKRWFGLSKPQDGERKHLGTTIDEVTLPHLPKKESEQRVIEQSALRTCLVMMLDQAKVNPNTNFRLQANRLKIPFQLFIEGMALVVKNMGVVLPQALFVLAKAKMGKLFCAYIAAYNEDCFDAYMEKGLGLSSQDSDLDVSFDEETDVDQSFFMTFEEWRDSLGDVIYLRELLSISEAIMSREAIPQEHGCDVKKIEEVQSFYRGLTNNFCQI